MLTIAHQLFTINLSKTFFKSNCTEDEQTYSRTDGQGDSYIPLNFVWGGGYRNKKLKVSRGFTILRPLHKILYKEIVLMS